MEGGELYDEIFSRISCKVTFSEVETARIIVQILSAIKFIHSNDIIHFDLKPENILFESQDNDVIKLIDFKYAQTELGSDKIPLLGCPLPGTAR
jgi:calcium/calmodulin-dependent protein kinase I